MEAGNGWRKSDELCRACLRVLPKGSLDDVIYDLFLTPDLARKFMACTSLSLDDDKLPNHLCEACFNDLINFYEFQTMCIDSVKRWHEKLQGTPTSNWDACMKFKRKRNASESGTESFDMPIRVGPLRLEEGEDNNDSGEKSTPLRESNSDTVKSKREDSNDEHEERESPPISRTSTVFQCDICPTRFFVEHRLIAHKRTHDGLAPYPCTREGCDKTFNRWHCLSEHLKQHEGLNSSFKCEEKGCGKIYKHKPTLVMHMRKYHKCGPELKTHICEICGKLFKSSAILNDHRYTHRDKSELPFVCDEANCARRFSNKEKLKVHHLRHAGVKNFVCSYCGVRKTTRNELKIHINYHTLERTWPCRFCTHVCNNAGNLKMHIRAVHERAKDYACSYCDRSFAKPDTRKYHEMTHTGEKPHQCKECGKCFTQPAALRTHRKIHLRKDVRARKTLSSETLNAEKIQDRSFGNDLGEILRQK